MAGLKLDLCNNKRVTANGPVEVGLCPPTRGPRAHEGQPENFQLSSLQLRNRVYNGSKIFGTLVVRLRQKKNE